MEVLYLPDDPLYCLVSYCADGTFEIKEQVYDPYEEAGYNNYWCLVAKGFSSRIEAERWLEELRDCKYIYKKGV